MRKKTKCMIGKAISLMLMMGMTFGMTGYTSYAANEMGKSQFAMDAKISMYDQEIHKDVSKTVDKIKKRGKICENVSILSEGIERCEMELYEQEETVFESEEEKIVALTYAYEVPTEEKESNDGIMTLASSGSTSRSDTDNTVSVKGTCTIYYSIKKQNGVQYYKMTKVSGSYQILQSGYSVTKQSVSYAQLGVGENNTAVNESKYNRTVTGSSWSVNTNFKKYMSRMGSAIETFQANYSLTIKRQGNPTTFTVQNSYTW